MALVSKMHVSWALRGTLAIASGHQTSLWSILEDSKTLNCEKKPWEESMSGCFGRCRCISAPQSKSDTSTCEIACAICCCGSTLLGYVVSDFTKYTIRRTCELIMPRANHRSKIQQVWVAEMSHCFILFALWGKWHWFAGMHVSWALRGTLAIARGHQTSLWSIFGRFQDAKLLNEALGSKFEWLFWTLSLYFSAAIKKWHVDLRECMCNMLLWVDLPRLRGLRLH
jgi:hypothetical protein